MLSTGIPELQSVEDLFYLRKSLSLDLKTEKEASREMVKLIKKSLSSKKTRLNHFSHLVAKS